MAWFAGGNCVWVMLLYAKSGPSGLSHSHSNMKIAINKLTIDQFTVFERSLLISDPKIPRKPAPFNPQQTNQYRCPTYHSSLLQVCYKSCKKIKNLINLTSTQSRQTAKGRLRKIAIKATSQGGDLQIIADCFAGKNLKEIAAEA